MNGDAVVAKGHRAHDQLTRQRTAAATEAVVQALQPKDRPFASGTVRRQIPRWQQRRGHVFVAGWGLLLFRQQTHLLPQTVERLLQRDVSKSQ